MIDEFKLHIDRLRASKLRPTQQRLVISKILFGTSETFHFTIEKLKKMVEKHTRNQISLATVYNTVHAFKKNGYIKEISLKSDKSFFDTNTKKHHHFYDEDTGNLIDIENSGISIRKIPSAPFGKKIKEVEIVVRVASNYHNQKK